MFQLSKVSSAKHFGPLPKYHHFIMSSCGKCWHRYVSVVEHRIAHVFGLWGVFVSRRPLIAVASSCVLAGILSAFVSMMESETQSVNLYAPENALPYENYEMFKSTWRKYQDSTGVNAVYASLPDDPSGNILTEEYMIKLLTLYDTINEMTVVHNKVNYTFQDLCMEYENGNCQVMSILDLFEYDSSNITSNFDTTSFTYPAVYSPYSYGDLYLSQVMGQNISIGFDSTSGYPIATATPAFALSFTLDLDKGEDICEKWYEEFLSILEDYGDDAFDLAYEGYASFDDELARAVGSDIILFVIGFNALGVFSTIMVLRFKKNAEGKTRLDFLRCRARIGWLGIISAGLAVLSSFGLVGGICQVPFNSVVAVAPFLLMGIGLDDMFVMLRAYELTPSSHSLSERMRETMQHGGVSILFTSITDLVAFGVGAASPFGSVSAFCWYCGVGVFMDFVYQITFFLGFMVYDSRYMLTGSVKETFCGDGSDPDPVPHSTKAVELETQTTPGTVSTETEQEENGNAGKTTDAVASSNDENENTSHDTKQPMIPPEATLEFMNVWGHFLMDNLWVKIVIAIAFTGYLAGAIVGIMGLEASQDPIDLAPNDSYLVDYYDTFERYFDTIGQAVQFIFDKELDYSDDSVIDDINSLVNSIRSDDCFINDSAYTTSWIHSYIDYLDTNYGGKDSINQSMFYSILYTEYLSTDEGEAFTQDIWSTVTLNDGESVDKDSYGSIRRSRIELNLEPMGVSVDPIAECLDNFEDLQDEYDSALGTYYYLYSAMFAASNLVTIQQTAQSLIYAMLAATVISLVLIPYPLMALIAMWTVGQILFGVMGYMSLWGLPINTTTMINVVLAVGFSVDNAAHFCHSFMNAPLNTDGKNIYIAKGETLEYSASNERKARVLYALNAVGMPIFAGDISTIIALLPLSTADSQIFVSFFKCVTLVMLFGVSHAIVYLPVVLSMIGPLGYDNESEQTEVTPKDKVPQNSTADMDGVTSNGHSASNGHSVESGTETNDVKDEVVVDDDKVVSKPPIDKHTSTAL